MSVEARRRFRALHEGTRLFVMPNPWDVGSAKLLEAAGFEALATTSQGLAWSLGKRDSQVTRDELVAHVGEVSSAVNVPLNVDSERCFPDDPGGVAETVRVLVAAGAAGCSLEDWDPATGAIEDVGLAAERVAEAAEAARAADPDFVVTGRAENHLRGVDDLDDTIARLGAYRDAGATCLYAPGLSTLAQVRGVVDAIGAPVNVLALPGGPTIAELASVGVRRVSVGSLLAGAAYGALVAGARELLGDGTSRYATARLAREDQEAAFG